MKVLYLFTCCVFLLLGCSKNSSKNDKYFIKYKIDNKTIEIREKALMKPAVFIGEPDFRFNSISFIGSTESSLEEANFRNMFSLNFRTLEAIKTNFDYTMHVPVLVGQNIVPAIQATYIDDQGEIYEASILRTQEIETLNEASIRFSEIGDYHVRGFFTATLVQSGTTNVTQSITEGEFYLELSKPWF